MTYIRTAIVALLAQAAWLPVHDGVGLWHQMQLLPSSWHPRAPSLSAAH